MNGFYGGAEKRQRGGRKKRRKNKEDTYSTQNWDDIYDPSRPNNYEEYKNSDEKILEIREWKDRLYAHRMKRDQRSYSDSEDEEASRPLPAAQNSMSYRRRAYVPNTDHAQGDLLLHRLSRLQPSSTRRLR